MSNEDALLDAVNELKVEVREMRQIVSILFNMVVDSEFFEDMDDDAPLGLGRGKSGGDLFSMCN